MVLPPNDGSAHCVDGNWSPTVLEDITYVVVALDPATSVRLLDAEAAVAAKDLKPQKYLALVRSKYGWYDASHTPHYEIDLRLVGRGLPKHPELDMDESMSVPIYPATEHPQSRPPLHPSQPLPWADCYHHTLVEFSGDAGRIHISESSPVTLSQSESAWRDLRKISSSDQRRAERYYDVSESEDSDDDESSIDDGGSVVSPPHSADVIEDILFNPRGLCLTYDIWLDLSVLDDVPDPIGLKKERHRLYQIKNDCDKRQKARYKEMKAQLREKESRTEAWAEQLGSEESNQEIPPREPADMETDQDLGPVQLQALKSKDDLSSLKEPNFTEAPSQKPDPSITSNSCLVRVKALTSSWTNKLRILYAKSRSRVLRVVVSRKKRFVRSKERLSV